MTQWNIHECRKCGLKTTSKTWIAECPDCKSSGVEFPVVSCRFDSCMTADELVHFQFPPRDWLIENLLLPSCQMVIGAPTAAGKTWIGMEIARAVSTGTALFGKFHTKQSNVLYIDRENGKEELQRRFKMIAGDLSKVFILSEENIRLDTEIGIRWLTEYIQEHQIGLVIVDTYRRVVSYREDKADDVTKFFDDLIKPLCWRTKASICLIHHQSKGNDKKGVDKLRGSSDLANNVEFVLQIDKEGDCISVEQSKVRCGMEVKPFRVKLEESDGLIELVYTGETVRKSASQRAADSILAWIKEKKKTSFLSVEAEGVADVSRNTFYQALGLLKAYGHIKTDLRGKYIVLDENTKLF